MLLSTNLTKSSLIMLLGRIYTVGTTTMVLLAVVFAAGTHGAAAAAAAADLAPWEDLKLVLLDPDTLQPGSIQRWQEQCVPPFEADDFPEYGIPITNGSNYQLFRQPSGQCMAHLGCAFEECDWPFVPANAYDPNTLTDKEETFNLPAYILHPTSVFDLVTAISFCGTHSVPITVKTSGHSYLGASTRKDTLLVHMGKYPKYSIDDSMVPPASFVQECDTEEEGAVNMTCSLAQARGKTAYLRVGGGEVWDEALRSVWYWNLLPENEQKQYHIVTGAAGTVSAAGGWLASGGNSGTTGMRMFGLGVDQVLHLEMVLPDGSHVRFGPSAWEDAPGYLYPKTTAVTGFCNTNPQATNEANWVWEPCKDDEYFSDLWLAVRGGGGGSFGIVTSVYYQLHEKPGNLQVGTMTYFLTQTDDYWQNAIDTSNFEVLIPLVKLYHEFHFDFFFAPEKLNVTIEDSNKVGTPGYSMNPFGGLSLYGYDGGNEVWAAAWRQYVAGNTDDLLAVGLTEDRIVQVASWALPGETQPAYGIPISEEDTGVPAGRIVDYPKPATRVPDAMDFFWHIPQDVLMDQRDEIMDIFYELASLGAAYVLGGHVADGTDQMTSVPANRRDAGLLVFIPPDQQDRILNILYRDGGGNFPGMLCHNHFGLGAIGPLKSDWTKVCPVKMLTEEEQIEQCYTQQEAVWGTELLARLEEIKRTVDPDSLFVVPGGVGFVKPTAITPTTAPTTDAPTPTTPTTDAPTAPTATRSESPTTTSSSGRSKRSGPLGAIGNITWGVVTMMVVGSMMMAWSLDFVVGM